MGQTYIIFFNDSVVYYALDCHIFDCAYSFISHIYTICKQWIHGIYFLHRILIYLARTIAIQLNKSLVIEHPW